MLWSREGIGTVTYHCLSSPTIAISILALEWHHSWRCMVPGVGHICVGMILVRVFEPEIVQ